MSSAVDAIRQAGAKYGLSQNVINAMIGIAHHESGLNPGSLGDGGTSYGLFQLHRGGALGNMSDAQARAYLDPYKNADFAARAIAGLHLGNTSVQDAVAQISKRFERPANPAGEINDAWNWLQHNGTGGGGGGSAPAYTPPQYAPNQPGPTDALSMARQLISQGVMPQGTSLADVNNQTASILATLQGQQSPVSSAPGSIPTSPGGSGSMYGGPGGSMQTGGYPLGVHGKLIGSPYQGTHTLGNWESDNAVDIAVPVGTPIVAAYSGKIGPQFGSLGEGGRFAGLRLHLVGSGGQELYYAHLSKFAPGLHPGMMVRAGQIIGYSGSANGVAHLHFAAKNGSPYQYTGH